MKRFLAIMTVLTGALLSHAQEQVDYLMEIGGGTGVCFYMGDANGVPFKGSSAMASVVFRRNFNPRMVLKANLAYGHYTGNTNGYYLPDWGGIQQEPVNFSGDLCDLGAQFEMNFWGYGIGPAYKNLSRITPYAVLGIGLTMGSGNGTFYVGPNFPVGLGVKYKVKPRLNLGLEWTMRFTTIDNMEGNVLDDPYMMESAGLKNKDQYGFLMFFVTYDFGPKYRKCNN